MNSTMQNFTKFLYRKQREVIDQLKGLVDGVDDIGATSLFQQLDDGFQDRGCNGNNVLITLAGQKEATGGIAHLHIKERYATSPPQDKPNDRRASSGGHSRGILKVGTLPAGQGR